ncbi:MAG: MFS transporter [Conexivisphaerales archaeon]
MIQEAKGYRWVVLASYTFVAFVSQLIWLNFAGIAEPQLTAIYNVGIDQVGYLAAFWPLVFIPLSIPTGLSTDRWGFKVNVAIGAGVISLFSWLRLLAGLNFNLLLLFQTLAGIGQPFVYNGISKMAGAWFERGEQTLANGIGTMGQIAGMIASLVITPLMVPDAAYSELRYNMLVFALLSTVAFVLFASLAKEGRGDSNAPAKWRSVLHEMVSVGRKRNIILLSFLFFIGVGIFSGLIQWTESILSSRGLSPFYASLVGASMLLSGIAGMVIVSYLADRYRVLKTFVVLNSLITAIFLLLFSFNQSGVDYTFEAVMIGFFLLSLAPVGLQISLETVGEERSGSAASIVWLSSQVGALVLILLMASFSRLISGLSAPAWFYSVLFCSVLMFGAAGLGILLEDTRKKVNRMNQGG